MSLTSIIYTLLWIYVAILRNYLHVDFVQYNNYIYSRTRKHYIKLVGIHTECIKFPDYSMTFLAKFIYIVTSSGDCFSFLFGVLIIIIYVLFFAEPPILSLLGVLKRWPLSFLYQMLLRNLYALISVENDKHLSYSIDSESVI